MCGLTKEVATKNPESALYGLVFNTSRTGSFTLSTIEAELQEAELYDNFKIALNRCFQGWVESGLIYKCFDGYRRFDLV